MNCSHSFLLFIWYLPFGGQRPSDGEEGVQSSLRASLSALHNLLTAVTYPVLAAHKNQSITNGGEGSIKSLLVQLLARTSHL